MDTEKKIEKKKEEKHSPRPKIDPDKIIKSTPMVIREGQYYKIKTSK
jgi:hypothetical protein